MHTYNAYIQCVQKTHELWSAALNGDTMAVTRLVINGAVPPNTCHPVTSAQLVLDIAAVSVPVSLPPPCGDSQAISSAPSATGQGVLNSAAPLLNKDSRLRRVLVALSCAGWEMSVRDPTTGANALHILASQPPPQLVAERLDYFVRLQQARPLLRNMLTAVTEAGQRPEDCAAADRGDLAASLRAVRLEIAAEVASAAADAAGASSGAASAGSASEDDYSIGSYMLVERNDESDIPQPYAGAATGPSLQD